ncbi:hypothetical protein [Arthrobacter zhaoguopingii]|uniref:hypothetical protein n=1 Tax=Arthrobacter zhaoguopingii TaxID=2681491 RepID=UPI0013580D40|nr:hypothetical protein [Arthrobacter zhaoguopingii]
MKIILSHPYAGALLWWMQSGNEWSDPKVPQHPYYRHLYGNVDKFKDLALACTVVFDEIVMAAADFGYPDSQVTDDYRKIHIPSLSLSADWDPVYESQTLTRPIVGDLLRDPVIARIISRVPKNLKSRVIEDCIADILLMREYECPLISSVGRRGLVVRLLELDVVAASSTSSSIYLPSGQSLADELSETFNADQLNRYVEMVGLMFRSPDVASLSNIKSNDKIRAYASRFQDVLVDNPSGGEDHLLEAISDAWRNRELAEKVKSGFSMAGRGLTILGLIPVVGTVSGVIGLGSEASEIAADQFAKRHAWYELGPEIIRLESMASLENYMASAAFQRLSPKER